MKKIIHWIQNLFRQSQFLRFFLVGVVNTIVGTTVMFLLYHCIPWNLPEGNKLPYWISTAANYIVGSTCSFFLNKYFTFRSKDWSWAQVVRFVVNIVVCYGIAYGLAQPLAGWFLARWGQSLPAKLPWLVKLFHSEQDLLDNLSMLVGLVIFVLINYLGQSLFAFQKKPSKKP